MYRADEQRRLMPESALHTSWLEDLVRGDPASVARQLTDFIGTDVSPGVEAFLADRVTEDRAHPGQWKADAGFGEAELARCKRLLDELTTRGVGTVNRYRGG